MRTIVHISDLHFGRTDENIVQALKDFIAELSPHVLVVSGDLTQRAKQAEFLQAKAFLAPLACPKIIVPGNHDISLYNLWRRFIWPHRRYQAHIQQLLEPVYEDAEVFILGLNTSRPLVFKGGRLNRRQLNFAASRLAGSAEKVKIVVTHHPLKGLRDRTILQSLVLAGADVFLSGHLHLGGIENFEQIIQARNCRALLVQVGTATSVRYRGEPNSFNVLTVTGTEATVAQYHWSEDSGRFLNIHTHSHQLNKNLKDFSPGL